MEGSSSRLGSPSNADSFQGFRGNMDNRAVIERKSISDHFSIELEGGVMNGRHGSGLCKEITKNGIKYVVRWLPRGIEPVQSEDVKSSNLLTPIKTLRKGSKCALLYVKFDMTIGWFIKTEGLMDVEFRDREECYKVCCFSGTTKDVLRDVIRIIVWLHKNAYTHKNLTVDDILLFKTNNVGGKEFYVKLTNRLTKHNWETPEGLEAFENSRNKDFAQLCKIVQSIVLSEQGKEANEEVQYLIDVLSSNDLARIDLVLNSPALWSSRSRLDFIKLLHANISSLDKKLLGFYLHNRVGDSWRGLFPVEVLKKIEMDKVQRTWKITYYDDSYADLIQFIRNVCDYGEQDNGIGLIYDADLGGSYSDMSVWIRQKNPRHICATNKNVGQAFGNEIWLCKCIHSI